MRFRNLGLLGIGFLAGSMVGPVFLMPLAAQIGFSWSKSEVVPVVFVEPGIGGFKPIEGSSIGNMWPKEKVVPMCKVKPSIGGFIPVEGSAIGNTWGKDEVRPVVSVKPYMGSFVSTEEELRPERVAPAPASPRSSCVPAVEGTIAGEFNGWEGETIFKLDNGQIWQQAEYDYTYSYSYRPEVTIYQTSQGCRMKVEDEDETILVRRIR